MPQKKFCVSTYQIRFGSWNKALELAGLPVKNSRLCGMTKEQYVELLKDYATKFGRVPDSNEIREARAIINRFGSWNKALEAAELPVSKSKKEELIEIIQEKARELKRVPKCTEIKRYSTIYRHFGSWDKALEAAEIPGYKSKKEKLIEIIQEKARELKRIPKSTEIKQYSTIQRHFGSWDKALEAAEIPGYKSKKEKLIEIIQEKARELKRVPKSTEIKQYSTIHRHFGSWNKALEAAGLSKENH
ncbi:hypothetical protein BTXL6_09950 [Bacillus thuringiensis]|nr:hypothetical protein BTXL6_27515 [Bacillus thuringiensis]ALL21767.1 hypothetical protein BTXL6_09950 [Bacillus thuringiensis]